VRDPDAHSSAKLLVASGVVSLIGILVPWVRIVEKHSVLTQTGLFKNGITWGVSAVSVTNLAWWISVLSLIPLAVGLVRQSVWKSMPDYANRFMIALAVADLVLLYFAWRQILSYDLGVRAVFQSAKMKGNAEIAFGLWLVVGAQIAVLVAGVKTHLFYEKNPFGRFRP
jgi:hypothetical protein